MIFDMTKRKSGNEYFVAPRTGCIYPRVLRQELSNFNIYGYGTQRWRFCDNLEDVTVIGLSIVQGAQNNDPFSDCPSLKRLVLPSLTLCTSYLARNTPQLQEVELGSIGTPVTGLYTSCFSGDSQSNLIITVFVADTTPIPLEGAPFGATNATVIYRSSTTGEVRTV